MAVKNSISWYEIPATDLNRAATFYETILGTKLVPMDTPEISLRIFPIEDTMTGISGALADSKGFHKPSATDGPLVYLNANPDVQIALDKVEAAGGKIIVPKMEIPDHGYMAVILDTEGNRVALHSIPDNYKQ
jgi:uncharacterized protein